MKSSQSSKTNKNALDKSSITGIMSPQSNNMKLKYHSLVNLKAKPSKKLLKHYGKPLVVLSKKDEAALKDVFDFYIGFPLHSLKRINAAHSLYSKLTQTQSDIERREVKVPVKAGVNKVRTFIVTKGV